MPNLTTPIPPKLTGETGQDLVRLKEWGTALVDELAYLFNNLDAGNVLEAAAVKAEHIDTGTAKITDAQIGALTADKLTTGTIDTGKVTVSGNNGCLELSDSQIVIRDRQNDRFIAAYDRRDDTFLFLLCNERGEPTVCIDSRGDAVFTGRVESSSIFSSTIVGTDSVSYANGRGGVFAQIDPAGIKVMKDEEGARKQKIGMSVGDDGVAYLVLGTGDGGGSHNINGVVYTNGSFKIEKFETGANMGLTGYAPFIHFWDNGELWLSGKTVLINGVDLGSRTDDLDNRLAALQSQVDRLERRSSSAS